jgi:amino acid adenylation domain-containing protein
MDMETTDRSERLQNLSAAKRALLLKAMREEQARAEPQRVIRRRTQAGPCPVSFAQQRLWFLDQLDPGTPAFNISTTLRLSGKLNVAALLQSLDEVVRRHESLRTTFVSTDGRPVQVVTPPTHLAMPVVDLTELSGAEREAMVTRLTRGEVRRPFFLARGPLLRATLLRLTPGECELQLTMHHIASDGWSKSILVREVGTLYQALNAGTPSPLPELDIQYADFAHWQRDWLESGPLADGLNYWREQLAGAPTLDLPTDLAPPPAPSYRGAMQNVVLPEELIGRLRALGTSEGATLFMTLLAAFQALLARYTGQDDISVGTTAAGRNRVEVEGLIGFFVNMLVLRLRVPEADGFRALLAQAREMTLGSYTHQEVPFERLVEELQPERGPQHLPLFRVVFTLQNQPREGLDLSELQLRTSAVGAGTMRFDLTMNLRERDGAVTGFVAYNTDLFAAATARRLAAHYERLLAGVLAQPDAPVWQLPLLGASEQQQLLVEWNDTQSSATQTAGCVHEQFERMAARVPDAIAVVCGTEQVSYRALNAQANRIARRLRQLGVGAESLVGVCVERSIGLVAALLGVLKAGGAYVPLDPAYPQERLAFMVADSGVGVILTERHLLGCLTACEAELVCLGELTEVAGACAGQQVAAGNAAYVIYTSGSTGRPKGVVVEHRSLANYTAAAVNQYALTPGDRALQFASINFDASAEEIYPCLASGATLVLRNERMLGSAREFFRTCREWGVTVLNLPTAYWHELVAGMEEDERARPSSSVRLAIIGGEAALAQRVEVWQRQVGARVRLFNTYGPTEATIVATKYELTPDGGAANGPAGVPIGRAVANAHTYVLAAAMQPAPLGVKGELYVGGAGLARGYLKRPELTAERFVPDPFGGTPGARLYRTGDLARHLTDGRLEFCGRADQQVKVRGFRIELGEIEAALLSHPAVRDAAAAARADGPGGGQLGAYVVAAGASAPAPSELREWLRTRLPEHMVPGAFVFLDALPLTPNGKLDRKALPEPGQQQASAEDNFVAAETPTEQVLAGIWAEVLKRDRVGARDNFFDLGGHSLLATQVMFRTCEAFQIELPLRLLFEMPTIEALAMVIEERLIEEIEDLSEDEVRQFLQV